MDPIELDHVPDIRLIVCDLDGTLLDDDNALHDDFWPVIDQHHQRGVTFCPASGRQYLSLRDRFEPMMDEAYYSFAMANAHPQLAARARFPAPGNTDNGVVRTIRSVLRL